MKHLYAELSKDQIAKKLISIGNEKLLVRRIVNKYRNNPHFSTIFNKEEVESELYATVLSVMTALEKYNKNKDLISKRESIESKLSKKELDSLKNKCGKTLKTKVCKLLKVKEDELEITLNEILSASNGDLKLDTESQLTGYLIVAFTNNIRKIYAKHQTEKRSFNSMVYLDAYTQEDEDLHLRKNKMDALISSDPEKEKYFSKIIVNMALYLKKQDKRINQINQNERSQLAQLFCAIVNPKKVEDNEELKKRFGWSQYLLNKNKETLIKKLREEFQDAQEDILEYLDQREQKGKAA